MIEQIFGCAVLFVLMLAAVAVAALLATLTDWLRLWLTGRR